MSYTLASAARQDGKPIEYQVHLSDAVGYLEAAVEVMPEGDRRSAITKLLSRIKFELAKVEDANESLEGVLRSRPKPQANSKGSIPSWMLDYGKVVPIRR